jgi:dihydrofolate reductase
MRRAPCLPAGAPWSRWITGAEVITASRFSYRATGRPARRLPTPLVTYVTDGIASAMAQAKTTAGDRNVMVHGAYTAQRALEAGVLDELQIHQSPVLFGGGRRMFDVLPSRIELEITRVIDTPDATHIRYRVRH